MKVPAGSVAVLAICLVLSPPLVAHAEYDSDFESLNAGRPLAGQDGWTRPTACVEDFLVYEYAGNGLGAPSNPIGGSKFIGALNPAGGIAGAIHSETFGSSLWTVAFDFYGRIGGLGDAGYFTIMNPAAPYLVNENMKICFKDYLGRLMVTYSLYDIDGYPITADCGFSPGPAWFWLDDATVWHRIWTTIDFATNRVTKLKIKNLATGVENDVEREDLYMRGGAAGPTYSPTAFRLTTDEYMDNPPVPCLAIDNLESREGAMGACCILDGSCRYTWEARCGELQGSYLGDAVPCDPNPCPTVPVRETTWGGLKTLYR